jgi:hypothetical protein
MLKSPNGGVVYSNQERLREVMAPTRGKHSEKRRPMRTKRQTKQAPASRQAAKKSVSAGREKPVEFSEVADGEITVIERRPNAH